MKYLNNKQVETTSFVKVLTISSTSGLESLVRKANF